MGTLKYIGIHLKEKESMDTDKRVIIGRPINGISINGLEYVLDEHNEVKEFASKKEAVQFLKKWIS
jgi:hypothetical protein